jgi:hypothetical protein
MSARHREGWVDGWGRVGGWATGGFISSFNTYISEVKKFTSKKNYDEFKNLHQKKIMMFAPRRCYIKQTSRRLM